MSVFIRVLEALTGRKSTRPGISASIGAGSSLGKARNLAQLTRMLTRDPVELEPPGPELRILLTDDIDPRTGKAYPDYMERRKRRREEEEAGKRDRCFGTVDHDVYPD